MILYSSSSASAGLGVIMQQLNLLCLVSPISLAAVYTRDPKSIQLYELIAQSPITSLLPTSTNADALSAMTYNDESLQESFSLPIIIHQEVLGYLLINLMQEYELNNKDINIIQNILGSITKLLAMEATNNISETAKQIENSNSNVVVIRTFLKMLGKRLPKDDYIGQEMIENTLSKPLP